MSTLKTEQAQLDTLELEYANVRDEIKERISRIKKLKAAIKRQQKKVKRIKYLEKNGIK